MSGTIRAARLITYDRKLGKGFPLTNEFQNGSESKQPERTKKDSPQLHRAFQRSGHIEPRPPMFLD